MFHEIASLCEAITTQRSNVGHARKDQFWFAARQWEVDWNE